MEYNCKLKGLSQKIITNTNVSLELLEKTSGVWHGALKNNHDLQNAIGDFLRDNKSQFDTLETNQTLIEIDINDFKKDAAANLDTSNILLELYTVYKKAYQLNADKNLTLEALDSQIHDLSSEFKTLAKSLLLYVPELESIDTTDKKIPASGSLQEKAQPIAVEAKIKQDVQQISIPVTTIQRKPQQEGLLPEKPNYTAQIKPGENVTKFKMLAPEMGFTQVERLLGVPLVKNKLQKNREVWLYPSQKSGSQYQVFFEEAKFLKWDQVTIKTNHE